MTAWKTEYWLDESKLKTIDYSDYWNDEEKERNKDWYVLENDFAKMERHLESTGLPADLQQCLRVLRKQFKRNPDGVGIDLASGTLWAAPYLLSLENIRTLYCLEYSKHRLLNIGPKVLEHYKVLPQQVVLVLGSFYDLHLADRSLDFAFLSQAFHHADDPERLLSEIRRVLKPGGIVLIVGEHVTGFWKGYAKHVVKFFVTLLLPEKIQLQTFGKTFNVRKFFATFNELFPPDPLMGDHFYTRKKYFELFSQFGFKASRIKRKGSRFQSFVLIAE